MASLTPGLALGTADSLANTAAGIAAKTATGNAQATADMDKDSIDKTLSIVGG